MCSTQTSGSHRHAAPLIVVAGPTASGKTALALALAERFSGEIVSCDSVAVYRGMEIGTAKPTLSERARVPHHLLDIASPDQPCNAGDYSRLAREAIRQISVRGNEKPAHVGDTPAGGHLPIVCGGTGLYLRALLDGLFPAPPHCEALRERLRARAMRYGPARLHRILKRLDPTAARLIHANDTPKVIRAIEVMLVARQPITRQWEQTRDPFNGFRVLRVCLNPPRGELYRHINRRAEAMFGPPEQGGGLVEETALLVARYGYDCRPFSSLGYAQAVALLRGEITREQAVAQAQQGHRNYAKRQLTWFRKDSPIHWLTGFGGDAEITRQACDLVTQHLEAR